MDTGLALGPFLFPVPLLILVLALVIALAVAGALQRRGEASAHTALWGVLLIALLAARLAFIVRRWPEYAAAPISMLNMRDGGFMAWPGVAVLLLSAGVVIWRRPRLRVALGASVATGLGIWLLATLAVTQLSVAMQRPLPDISVHALDGRPVGLRSLSGKPMAINLWATWCPPCRREMPMLIAAQARMPGVRFVFLDQAESPAKVREYLAKLPAMPHHVLIDEDRRLARNFGIQGTPTTLFVDAHGVVRDIHVGELSAATLAEGLSHTTRPR